MTYKIIIERSERVKKMVGKDWQIASKDENGVSTYDYLPEIEKEIEITNVVYTQVVDALDLIAVIDAVNKPMTAVKE